MGLLTPLSGTGSLSQDADAATLHGGLVPREGGGALHDVGVAGVVALDVLGHVGREREVQLAGRDGVRRARVTWQREIEHV